jgi:hypothetical protein
MKHPLAEVFGFPVANQSREAIRHREKRLCPFNNKVPNCTKDKANDPLGVCSIYDGDAVAVTCPVRFREDWLIADDAASFFFASEAKWTSLLEVRLNDKHGKSAGNIDVVLVAYDEQGKITDFGSLEIQAVYISGNIRAPFQRFMQKPTAHAQLDWSSQPNYPRPDYLSSSRKRLAPQLLFKGGIFHAWRKKQAVALHRGFYDILPSLTQVKPAEADLAWLIYDFTHDKTINRYRLTKAETVYTKFQPTMLQLTTAEPGPVETFVSQLQAKLDEKLDNNPPDAPTLGEVILS